MARQQKKGWYPDPASPGLERYWDGTTWTNDSRQAPPSKKRRRGGGIMRIALGVVLGMCVLIGGCAALIGAGVDEAEKDQDKHAITATDYRTVKVGMSKSEVKAALGDVPPGDAQEFENEGLPGDAVKSSCEYYNEKGKGLGEGRYFQLCYDDDRLTGKNAY